MWPTTCFCKSIFIETAIFTSLCIVYGCFIPTTAELGGCNRDYKPQSQKYLHLALKKNKKKRISPSPKELTLGLFDNPSLIYIGKIIFRIIL